MMNHEKLQNPKAVTRWINAGRKRAERIKFFCERRFMPVRLFVWRFYRCSIMTFEAPSRLEVLEKESAQFYQNWHKVRREKEALEVKIDEISEQYQDLKTAAKVILTWVEAEKGALATRDKSDISNLLRNTLKLGGKT